MLGRRTGTGTGTTRSVSMTRRRPSAPAVGAAAQQVAGHTLVGAGLDRQEDGVAQGHGGLEALPARNARRQAWRLEHHPLRPEGRGVVGVEGGLDGAPLEAEEHQGSVAIAEALGVLGHEHQQVVAPAHGGDLGVGAGHRPVDRQQPQVGGNGRRAGARGAGR